MMSFEEYLLLAAGGDTKLALDPKFRADQAPLYTIPPQRKPLTINEVEQILAQHNYEIHGDRARYIVRMTEEAHGIKGEA